MVFVQEIITTTSNISKLLDSGLQTDIIFLDLSKASDKVPHHRLCNKLYYYGIRCKVLVWIENFLTGRQQQVILDGSYSDSHIVDSGIPQGGPFIVLMFNSLPSPINANMTPFFSMVLFILHLTVCHSKITLTPYHNGVSNLICVLALQKVYI